MTTITNNSIINMMNEGPEVLINLILPRFFTGGQVKQISDKNIQTYDRCVRTWGLNRDELYLFQPILLHRYACGSPVDVHIRVMVYRLSTKTEVGFQDVTFEQYEKGYELTFFNNQLN
jgi:hypothetical protein